MPQQRITCDRPGRTASIAGQWSLLSVEAQRAGWQTMPHAEHAWDAYRSRHYCPAHAGLPEISSLPAAPRV